MKASVTPQCLSRCSCLIALAVRSLKPLLFPVEEETTSSMVLR
eukprot:CAMPEP_0173258752 /NCGR_PEP_ID=MMETSP1142-20121109/24562_1 /TAXON_ID=483371 /ORGANISM="non described non described, Strain CCMP2298" /LENGTH=42 /DNA_ID= /DNA_START= /DNA_END= /DNA_ORIENTATION=